MKLKEYIRKRTALRRTRKALMKRITMNAEGDIVISGDVLISGGLFATDGVFAGGRENIKNFNVCSSMFNSAIERGAEAHAAGMAAIYRSNLAIVSALSSIVLTVLLLLRL